MPNTILSESKKFVVHAELVEEVSGIHLKVKGSLPKWLSGTLVRNGPINFSVNGKSNPHWFDGLAMLHSFEFHQGRVKYSNKFLRSDDYRTVFTEGTLDYNGFASDPCRSTFKRFFTWLMPHKGPKIHNANVNVAKIAEQYVAMTEVPLPVRFDPKTLETLGVLDYQDRLPKDECWMSAHPHYDSELKRTINYLIQYGRTSSYVFYYVSDDSPERKIIAEIPVEEPAYMHSFAVTENYIVLTEFPFLVKPIDLLTKGIPFIKNFAWKPERGTTFLVIDRKNGKEIGRYNTDPFFAFHHVNAFESNDDIVFDIICYQDALSITDSDKLLNHSEHYLKRFVLDLNTGKFKTIAPIPNAIVEFPRINEDYDGKHYRYVYLTGEFKNDSKKALFKTEPETRRVWMWSEDNCHPGEPVFIASPEAKDEDDGVIMSVITNDEKNSSFLLILDAKTFTEVGRAEVIHKIPEGLHGQFFKG